MYKKPVGWVERSDTEHTGCRKMGMLGVAYGSTQPAGLMFSLAKLPNGTN
ncbi:hypothetical protein QKW35_06350 [Pontibacterium granulatum]|nr:hypothetical protein [Pontibacterium granulatum]MDI3323991.1 hypothetical protein [Pontibacterium granulatum]